MSFSNEVLNRLSQSANKKDLKVILFLELNSCLISPHSIFWEKEEKLHVPDFLVQIEDYLLQQFCFCFICSYGFIKYPKLDIKQWYDKKSAILSLFYSHPKKRAESTRPCWVYRKNNMLDFFNLHECSHSNSCKFHLLLEVEWVFRRFGIKMFYLFLCVYRGLVYKN